jgi:Glycosyl transferase family 2
LKAFGREAIRTKAMGVIVPVHNEEDLLRVALDAIDDASSQVTATGIECRTAIMLDRCTDASEVIAREWVRQLHHEGRAHQAIVRTCRTVGVGNARREGSLSLLRAWASTEPRNIWLATTDADSRVPMEWLTAQLEAHERGADIWTGRVAVEDWSLYEMKTERRWVEAYDNEAAPIHGASLGFNAQMYLDAGGFASLDSGEDRALHRAVVALGGNTQASSTVKVVTSGRRLARAPRGFSYALCSIDRDITEDEKIA